MIAYAANVLKDKVLALEYCDKALTLDPADPEAVSYKDAIAKMNFGTTQRASILTGASGDRVVTTTDGTLITTSAKDGAVSIVTKAGKVTTYKDGVTTIVEKGKVTIIGKDGKVLTTQPPAPPKPAPVSKKTDTVKKKVKAKPKK